MDSVSKFFCTIYFTVLYSAFCEKRQRSIITYKPLLHLSSKWKAARKNGFDPRAAHAGFVVEKPTLGQAFVRVFLVSPTSVIAPKFKAHISFISRPLYIVMAIQGAVK